MPVENGPYPRWRFFPASSPPPGWVDGLALAFSSSRTVIDSTIEKEGAWISNDVLGAVAKRLTKIGFEVESGKSALGKLPRPVLFGPEGSLVKKYEIDAFNASEGVALEVERGRAMQGNAVYRDLIQGSLMVDVRFLAIAVPIEYRYKSGGKLLKEKTYAKTEAIVEAIYGSSRLKLPFDGVLIIGY